MNILISIIVLINISNVWAADETTSVSISTLGVDETREEKDPSTNNTAANVLSGSLALEYSSDLKKEDDPAKQHSTSIILAPVYTINSKAGLEGRIDFIQDLQDEKKARFSNLIVIGNPYTFDLKKEILTFKPKLGVTAPTDDVAYNDDAFRGAISLRPTLTWTVQQLKGLTLSNITYLTQNFHEFEVNRAGSANTQYSLRNRIAVGYGVTDRLSLELINDYARGWSYNGFVKDSFYFGQKLSYEVVKSWLLAVSHTNEGGARSANNSNNNVEVFDDKSSMLAAEISKEF